MSYKIFIRINLSIILTFLSHISYADMVEVGIQDAKRFFLSLRTLNILILDMELIHFIHQAPFKL